MKKTILAMTIAATAFMASCGNKTSEESESEVTPVEETVPEVEEIEIEVDSISAEVDSTLVEVEEAPSN